MWEPRLPRVSVVNRFGTHTEYSVFGTADSLSLVGSEQKEAPHPAERSYRHAWRVAEHVSRFWIHVVGPTKWPSLTLTVRTLGLPTSQWR